MLIESYLCVMGLKTILIFFHVLDFFLYAGHLSLM